MANEEREMIHNMDKSMAELAVILKNQARQIEEIFGQQAKREDETKEILKAMSSSVEQNKNISDRLIFILKKVEKVSDESVELSKKQEVFKVEIEKLNSFNKKVVASLLTIGGTLMYSTFTMMTPKITG